MKKVTSVAYQTSLELLKKLKEEGIVTRKRLENVSGMTYYNYQTKHIITTKGKFAYVATEIFEGLSKGATLMVCKIMTELKPNNALWYYDQTVKPKTYPVISELRERKILFETETTRIHFVNPFYIRHGMPVNIVFRMIELLHNTSRVSEGHIKQLAWEGTVQASNIDFFTLI